MPLLIFLPKLLLAFQLLFLPHKHLSSHHVWATALGIREKNPVRDRFFLEGGREKMQVNT